MSKLQNLSICLLALVLGLMALSAVRAARAEQAGQLILIINVDTLRRDRLGIYGNTRGLTPNIDRIARQRGVVFDAAYATSNHTYPSVASLVTGRYPTSHGFWNPGSTVAVLEPNIATILPKPFVKLFANANPNTVPAYQRSFDDSWSEYPVPESPYYDSAYFPAEYVFGRARDLVEAHRRPAHLLLYVQPADPHGPYYPLRKYPDLFAGDPLADKISGRFKTEFSKLLWDDNLRKWSKEQIQNARNRYDAEVRYLDEEVGRFLNYLLPLYPNHVVILTADHGESFLDHGDAGHGSSLFDEQIRTPFVVIDTANRFGASRRVTSLVSNVDILPTLAALAAVPSPPTHGVALQATLKNGAAFLPLVKRRVIVSETVMTSGNVNFEAIRPESARAKFEYFKKHPVQLLIRASIEESSSPFGVSLTKYIQNENREATDLLLRFPTMFLFQPHYQEMYRLDRDPFERQNVYDRAVARRISERSPLKDQYPTDIKTPRPSREQIERLRALGYIGGGTW
jgi:arylsulfatase A-like enzyme